MARLLITYCALIVCITIYSQPFGKPATGFRIVRQEYKNSSDERGATNFRYNLHGLMDKSLWILDDSSRYSYNRYCYDSRGNMVSSFRDFSDSMHSHEVFFYDADGNKTEEYFYRSDSVSGSASYTYEDGKLTKADYANFKGWITADVNYTYEPAGRCSGGFISINSKKVGEIIYAYDAVGNCVREHWDFNGRWSQTFTYLYEPIDLPRVYYTSPFLWGTTQHYIVKEEYTFNDQVGGPSYYTCNADGQLTMKQFVRTDSLTTTTTYAYDAEGRLDSSLRKFADGSSTRFAYVYNDNNELVARYMYNSDSLSGFEIYSYADGILQKGYLKNFDGWLTGSIVFTSDPMGNLVQGIFKGEDGFDAVIGFVYNSQGLVTEIRWDFSFGKFQKYMFTYN